MNTIRNIKWIALSVLFAVLCGIGVWIANGIKDSSMSLATDDRINITPQQIQSIRAIGQWEFLSVQEEEMIDTVRKGFFTDHHLARIYYGTLRLGVNLKKAKPGWITAKGDSVIVILPPIELLDNDFIDETATKSFYESGRWSAADREAMYQKAYRRMKRAGMSEANITSAENNADAQLRTMMRSMGFSNVVVRFDKAD